MSLLRKVFAWAHDGIGNPLSSTLEQKTGKYVLNVHDQDIGSPIVNQGVHRHTLIKTTLSIATSGDGSEYIISVVSTTGFLVGDFIHIEDGIAETTHPQITSLTATTFTLDRRIDRAHPIGTNVTQALLDLSSAAGSMATPIEYWVGPLPGEIWHIYRILPVMTHSTAGDLGLFGNIAALPNGVLLRARIDGKYKNYTNWKTAGGIKADMFDVEFDTRSGGGGTYGTSGRGSFKATGTAFVLDGDTEDRLEVYIQDDLTGLVSFTINAQGHIEE